ncbi:MAG TPA: hypothetical protein VNN77_14145 [candidate division Zixibacteria bacterium]|nr:hypothetical protein [candidate division Zixibacteria bacterium]
MAGARPRGLDDSVPRNVATLQHLVVETGFETDSAEDFDDEPRRISIALPSLDLR